MLEYQERIDGKKLRNDAAWNQVTKTMLKCAKVTCGIQDTRSENNQWMHRHEEVGVRFKNEIKRKVRDQD